MDIFPDVYGCALQRGGDTLKQYVNDTLKLLYDRFYTPGPMEETGQEIKTCGRQLIERLGKPERKLVLRIIDDWNLIIRNVLRTGSSWLGNWCAD